MKEVIYEVEYFYKGELIKKYLPAKIDEHANDNFIQSFIKSAIRDSLNSDDFELISYIEK